MADKRKPPESGGGPRRKRAAPTIDLKATEVTPDPAEETPAAATPDPQSEPPPEPTPVPEVNAAAPEPASEEPAKPELKPEPKSEPEPKPEPKRAAPPPPPPPSRGGLGAGVTGGVIGAVIVAAIGGGLWAAGYIPSSSTQPSDLPGRVATLAKQVQALQNKPAPKVDTTVLDKNVAGLSQRVSKLENELGNLPPADKAAAQNLAALDSAVKSLKDTVSALGKRVDTIAGTAKQAEQDAAAAQKEVGNLKQSVQDVASAQGQTPSVTPGALNAVQKKIAALETALATASSQLGGEIKSVRGDMASAQKQVAQAAAGERATRLVLSATALRNAVLSGAPYGAELAQAKSLGADAKALVPLAHFASRGLPSRNELANELIKLIPAMRKAAGETKSSGDFLARLQANAEKLVRVTPVQTPTGNAPSDTLARLEVEAAHADIANALADLAKLPDGIRAPAKSWIAKAKARQAAIAAARDVAARATRALGKG